VLSRLSRTRVTNHPKPGRSDHALSFMVRRVSHWHLDSPSLPRVSGQCPETPEIEHAAAALVQGPGYRLHKLGDKPDLYLSCRCPLPVPRHNSEPLGKAFGPCPMGHGAHLGEPIVKKGILWYGRTWCSLPWPPRLQYLCYLHTVRTCALTSPDGRMAAHGLGLGEG
jgi:hypothetical protein